MATHDPRVDAYIEKSAAFAQPILKYLRACMHKHGLAISETIRWGFPHFDYQGRHFCGMAAFKAHCAFYFRSGDALPIKARSDTKAMGQFGRITALGDLPSEAALTRHIKAAMRLHDKAASTPRPARPKTPKALVIPDFFLAALKKNRKARQTFDAFSPSNKREYVEWITEAKTDTTREKRLSQALVWMAEGKPRNWKYLTRVKQEKLKRQ